MLKISSQLWTTYSKISHLLFVLRWFHILGYKIESVRQFCDIQKTSQVIAIIKVHFQVWRTYCQICLFRVFFGVFFFKILMFCTSYNTYINSNGFYSSLNHNSYFSLSCKTQGGVRQERRLQVRNTKLWWEWVFREI